MRWRVKVDRVEGGHDETTQQVSNVLKGGMSTMGIDLKVE